MREISSTTNNPAYETVITKLVSPSDTVDVDINDIRLAYSYSDEVDVDYGRLSELVGLDDTALISINSSEQPLVYDSESDSYTAQNWSISVKKTDGGYILSGTGSLDGELTYDAALGQYTRKVYQSDISPGMFEFEIGIKQLADKLIVDADGESMEFTKGVDDCFHLNMNNIEMSLCKNDGGYTLVQKDDARVQEMELSCDDLSDICKYKDSLAYVVTLRESKDEGKFFSYHPVIFYSAAKDEYSIAALQTVLDASPYKNAAKATAFIFREKSDRVMPENLPNPQTSDAALKAIIIASIGLVPILFLRKQLSKRTN